MTAYHAIGRLIMFYNFVELNLRRMVEAWEEAGLLTVPISGKARDLVIGSVETTVQAMFPWPENELGALKSLAKIRLLRNLVAHFAVRRFPDGDAFVFFAKSERDFRHQFGGKSAPNEWLTAILDGDILPNAVEEVEKLQVWLATQASIVVRQAHDIRTGVALGILLRKFQKGDIRACSPEEFRPFFERFCERYNAHPSYSMGAFPFHTQWTPAGRWKKPA